MSRVLGIDVGGTFTDVFELDETTGRFEVAKVPSQRSSEASGFVAGLAAADRDWARSAAIVHGTTVGTNALLERRLAPVGLITTAGFRDVLEMRRRDRPQTWGLWGDFDPTVPRYLRLEVAERTLADGTVLHEVDRAEVERVAKALLERGAEAACIVFLHCYANAANEQAAAAAVREVWPNSHVAVSSEILPEIREFERTSTTALNAGLQPVVSEYLAALESHLTAAGFAGEFLIVASNGGVMTVETAQAVPIRTALSGPAAGVEAAGHIARSAGIDNVITCDMGGTSFDVSVIADGVVRLTDEATVDFGLVIRSPMVEVTTIGSGGGSIAAVDRGGILTVGPESAGSVPGPACYLAGNTRPTVTDANLVLGRIDGSAPIGGLDRLDVDAARGAISEHVAQPLGLDVVEAAGAILDVATAAMAGAIRLVSVERGHDPGKFAAMPFGGAGAMFCCGLLTEVGLARALIPRFPGVTSALGCVIADMRHDMVQTLNAGLVDLDISQLNEYLRGHEAMGSARLDRSDVEFVARHFRHELDMSYVGQTHTVAVPIDEHPTSASIAEAFASTYSSRFGRTLEGVEARVLTLRTAAIGKRPKFDLAALAPSGQSLEDAFVRSDEVWFGGEIHPTRRYRRLDLPVGARIEGPAILGQPDATTVVEPGFVAEVDRYGNLSVFRADI